jgi:hypothetical protein
MEHPAQEDPIIDFDDFDDDPDDNDAIAAYAAELQAAVEAFGVTPLETGQRNEEL